MNDVENGEDTKKEKKEKDGRKEGKKSKSVHASHMIWIWEFFGSLITRE